MENKDVYLLMKDRNDIQEKMQLIVREFEMTHQGKDFKTDAVMQQDFSEKYAEYLRLNQIFDRIQNAIDRSEKLSINETQYNITIPDEYKNIIQQLPPIKRAIAEELILVSEAIKKEEILATYDQAYSEYHNARKKQYQEFIIEPYNQILGFNGNLEQIIDNMSSLNLSPEKMNQIRNIRKEPILIQFKGEFALQKKSELESVLGIKISPNGPTFVFENSDPQVTIKPEEQLQRELNSYNEKLSELAEQGKITDEQESNYYVLLSNIYDYYMSKSRGEHIPYRKYSNIEKKEIIDNSLQTPSLLGSTENDIFHDEFLQQSINLRSDFNEMQNLQRGASHR